MKKMPRGEAEMHYQFGPYFICRVSWLPIITNLGSLSQIDWLIDWKSIGSKAFPSIATYVV